MSMKEGEYKTKDAGEAAGTARVVYVGAKAVTCLPDGTELRRGEPVELPAGVAAGLLRRGDFKAAA